jgi:hypothetical protein
VNSFISCMWRLVQSAWPSPLSNIFYGLFLIGIGPDNTLEKKSVGLADRTKCHLQEIKESTHVSGRPSDRSAQLVHLSHLGSSYCSRETTTLSSVIMSKHCVLVMVSYREFVSLVIASTLIVLILATALEECMGIGARHHMYSYFSVSNVCLKSRRQFVQCLVCTSKLLVSRDKD